jgi:glycosyltransferase involved in cell wall biosynthesis
LHRGGLAVTATLVGGGPDEARLRAQVEKKALQNAIRFAPVMPARRALTLGKVMVVPSRAESLPYVVLETAASGMPLITTKVGGIPEIYGPLTDTLVPAGDVQALSDAIARVIADPIEAAEIAQELRHRVATSFSVDTMVEGVLSAYRQALGEPAVMASTTLAPRQ